MTQEDAKSYFRSRMLVLFSWEQVHFEAAQIEERLASVCAKEVRTAPAFRHASCT